MNPALVPIPERMQSLKRDRRGYPIPVIVLRDKQGHPHFTINDRRVVLTMVGADACHMCGQRLGAHKWFAGGPFSALHHKGAYIDGPMHRECGQYALQVCPYLSQPWARRIDAKTLKPGALDEGTLGFINETVHPHQPSVFVLADCATYAMRGGHFHPIKPWREVQFWRHGEQLTAEAAREIIATDPNLPMPFAEIEGWWK